jgi:GNAT superfamily N-acetyltransferase
MTQSPEVRLYRPGDEAGIRGLFKEVFGREMSFEEWVWKYSGAKSERVWSSVAVTETNEVVAHYGGMPKRMIFNGREIKGIAIGDVMVHPKYRGLNVFRKVVALLPQETEKHGFVLGYGFPNERALRLPEKLGLYEKVEDVSEACKEVQFYRNLPRYAYRFFPLQYDDRRIDRLWEKVKGGIHLAVIRDREYLSERYQRHPLYTYELWGLRRRWEMRLSGIAILRREKERMLLIDFVCPLDLLGPFFQKIENYVYTTGIKRLVFWFPDYLRERVASGGFSIYPSGTSIPRTNREKWLTKAEIEGKFFYAMGDTDFM